MGHGIALRHPEVLALQVKTTWLDTAGFGDLGLDPNKYIRIKGKIPTYDMSDPKKWIRNIASNGSNVTKDAELALVGAHVVGSASGNSNMIWATFEHVDNTPVATYAYQHATGRKDFHQSACRQDVAQSTCGGWLFSQRILPGAPPASFNRLYMNAKNAPNIEAAPGHNIEPSDTRREHAWGSSVNDPDHNSRVIGINTGSMGMLTDGDVRRNYLLIGASWGGGSGSDQLANTTLETYEQNKNCSECHLGNKPDELSHMYRVLAPLFSP